MNADMNAPVWPGRGEHLAGLGVGGPAQSWVVAAGRSGGTRQSTWGPQPEIWLNQPAKRIKSTWGPQPGIWLNQLEDLTLEHK